MSSTDTPGTSRDTLATGAVILGATSWLGLAALVVTGSWASLPTLAAAVVFGGCWIGARVLIRDIAERRRAEVDEYELAQRHEARDAGYVATLGLGWVAFLALVVATNLAERGDDTLLLAAPAIVFTALVGGSALPTFLIAWRLRHQLSD